MIYRTRKLIKPEDLNGGNTLFGGRICSWIDEEAAIYAMCRLGTKNVVTKTVSIDFIAPAYQKDIIEIGVRATKMGITSITLHVIVRNKETENIICDIDNMVFVSVDENGKKLPHGKILEDKIETETITIGDYTYELSTSKAFTEAYNGDYCICLNTLKTNDLPENINNCKPFILKWYIGNNCNFCRKIISSNNPSLNKPKFVKLNKKFV